MKVLLHEYAGYAFPVQLARAIAGHGYEVVLAYFRDLSGPQRNLGTLPTDPKTLRFHPLGIKAPHQRFNFLRRRFQERQYGAQLARLIQTEQPDVTILSNTPLDVVDVVRKCVSPNIKLVWWLQDVFGIGIGPVLRTRFGLIGEAIGWVYRDQERKFAKRADHIVVISEDFIEEISAFGVCPNKLTVVENWAPLDEVIPVAQENVWKCEHGLAGKKLILYSGTLGFKHNPSVLVETAKRLKARHRDDVAVAVISEGLGADFLIREKERLALTNLVLLGWQPYTRLSEVLSAGDILVALIEKEAARFSVPSKVLSYLCAGRPMVCAIPKSNLAARTVQRANAGFVVEPDDVCGFIDRLFDLLDDDALREQLGKNGRDYAEHAFEIEAITSRFIQIIDPRPL